MAKRPRVSLTSEASHTAFLARRFRPMMLAIVVVVGCEESAVPNGIAAFVADDEAIVGRLGIGVEG